MNLKNDRELANTREKLRMLEDTYEHTRDDMTEDAHVRELSLRSLKRLINQLMEEIARYEARPPARKPIRMAKRRASGRLDAARFDAARWSASISYSPVSMSMTR